jgi:hypothetical protein
MKKLFLFMFLFACFTLQAQVIQVSPLQDITSKYNQVIQQNADQSKLILNYTTRIDSLSKALSACKGSVSTPVPPPVTTPTIVPGLVTYDFLDATFPSSAWQSNITLPNTTGYPKNNGQPEGSDGFHANVEYNNMLNSVTSTISRYPGGKSIHLVCNPFNPGIPSGADGVSNFRAEIALYPFHYPTPLKTEQYFSWSYYFPNGVLDPSSTGEGCIHQLHAGMSSPAVELKLMSMAGNNLIVEIRSGNYNTYSQKNINTHYAIPTAKWIDFVEYVIWSTGDDGIYKLWIIDETGKHLLVDYKGANTFTNAAYGGTLKLGIYHYAWHSTSKTAASNSIAAGFKQAEVYIGPIKTLTRAPGNYIGDAGFDIVKP